MNTMPVQSELEMLYSTDGLLDVDFRDILDYTHSLVSDEIWDKFGMSRYNNYGLYGDLHQLPQSSNNDIIRNHDCMWNGRCASKEHPAEEYNKNDGYQPLVVPNLAPGPQKAPVKQLQQQQTQQQQYQVLQPQQPVQPGRSVLLKTVIKQPAPLVPSPESPPMSDDEENKIMIRTPTQTLQMLNDIISECDFEEDSDLCEYLCESEKIVLDPIDDELVEEEEEEEEEEDEEEEEEEEEPVVENKARSRFENDHCYYMEKSPCPRVDNLGIDTPSDSEEEEIDVVSVTEKFTTNRTPYNLPTNPSFRDRHQLQKKMATVISNKRLITPSPARIKTIMPIRKPPTIIEPSPVKRRQESRGVKRSLPQKTAATTNGTSPYKRRGGYSMHNSDSEPEPSEKRSMHNNMERQRRIDLRNAFEDLRVLVPEVNCKEKAAKVAILREAAQYCNYLQKVSANMMNQKAQLQLHQDNLKARVRGLRIQNYKRARQ